MTRPNFFCDLDSLNCLLKMEFRDDVKDIDLTMDFIELPYYFIYTSDDENWTMKVFQRGDIYMHTEEGVNAGKVVVNKTSGEGQGETTQTLGDNIDAFFEACRSLSRFASENKLDELCEDFDPEEKGILLYVEDDQLKYRVVEGKERPDMMCQSLFGGTVMARPYMEDFWERSARAEMTIEDLIEEAEDGDTDCMEELAMGYLNGEDEFEASPEKAVYWFRKLAEAGSSNGMFNMGLHYAKGHGVERDFKQAVEWMEKAAKAGDEDAPNAAREYRKLVDNSEKAKAGDAQAQADYASGLMKLGGSLDQAGNDKDYEECVYWAQKAAEQGNGLGMWVLALAYEHGRGVKTDINKAIEWFREGSKRGNPNCMQNLACEYLSGEHIQKNKRQGVALLKCAAEKGYGLAMQTLGRCYQFGDGVPGNMKTALEWYEKALEKLNDPELADRVMGFRSLANIDPGFGEDYGENEEDRGYVIKEELGSLEDVADYAGLKNKEEEDKVEVPVNTSIEAAQLAQPVELVEEGIFTRAIPDEALYPHYKALKDSPVGALGFLGIQMNATGTEYGNELLSNRLYDLEPQEELAIRNLINADKGDYRLNQIAEEMTPLFRVNVEVFDSGHDRESDIKHDMIHRAWMMSALRSFGWTLCDYATRNNIAIKDIEMSVLNDICKYIEEREWLNYDGSRYLPGLCGCSDLHVYYIPDAAPEASVAKLKEKIAGEEENEFAFAQIDSTISSLDALRRDLSIIAPAMIRIYKELEKSRDRNKALEGGVADILYTWCSLVRTARETFFSEDGPMTCWWQHPDEEARQQAMWEAESAAYRRSYMKQHREEWLANYGKYLEENPTASFNGKLYAFAGLHGENGEKDNPIVKEILNRGAVYRTNISGKTDYLVVEPLDAGASKIKKVIEQRNGGKYIKVITAEDMSRILGMEYDNEVDGHEDPEMDALIAARNASNENMFGAEEPAADAPASAEDEISDFLNSMSFDKAESETVSAPAPAFDLNTMSVSTSAPIKVTYNEQRRYEGDSYSIAVPDGFEYEEGKDDRDFVAWLPNKDDPDFYCADITFYAGQLLPIEGLDPELMTDEVVGEMAKLLGKKMAAFGSIVNSEGSRFIPLKDTKPAGGIVVIHDQGMGAIHYYAVVALGGVPKMMRVMVQNAGAGDLPVYDRMVEEWMRSMEDKRSAKMIASLDDPAISRTPVDATVKQNWMDCFDKNVTLFSTYLNYRSENIVEEWKEKNEKGITTMDELKQELREALRDMVGKIERFETAIGNSLEILSADSKGKDFIKEMLERAENYIEDTKEFTINLDDDAIKAPVQTYESCKGKLANIRKKLEEANKELLKEYKQEMAKWEDECRIIKRKRESVVESRIREKAEAIKSEASDNYERKLQQINQEIAELEKKREEANTTLAGLGMFKGAEKKEQKAIISQAIIDLNKCEARKTQAREIMEEKINEARETAKRSQFIFEQEAERQYPLPKEPAKSPEVEAALKKEEEEKLKDKFGGSMPSATQIANQGFKEIIYNNMEPGRLYTISEFAEEMPFGEELGNQRVSAIVRQLVVEGKLIRTEEKRKAYFSKN